MTTTATEGVRRRSTTRRTLLMLLALLAVLVGGAVGVVVFVAQQISKSIEWFGDPFAGIETRPPVVETEPGERAPVNILLLGSDSRISAGDPAMWEAGAQRTDAILLLHLPADREKLYLMSIPRDSWVDIPGHGQAKINAAFSYGGPSLLVETVENLTGIRVDHLAVADFESFARLTDHLGGVEVTIPEETYDRRRQEPIPAGTYTMDGEQALDYVRQRYGLPNGDLDRVQRQQNWIRSIAASAREKGVLDNPYELTRLLLVLSDSVAADDSLTVATMRDLAMSARAIDISADITFFTAPITGLGTSADGQSTVVVDSERLGAVSTAIADDDLAQFLADHPGYLETLGEDVN